MILRIVAALVLASWPGLTSAAGISPVPPLTHVGGDPRRVTISGVGDAGFAAVEYAVAYSGSTAGVAAYRTGPYACGWIYPHLDPGFCMVKRPQWRPAWTAARFLARDQAVDPLRNLRRQRIYLSTGSDNRSSYAMDQLRRFYRAAHAGPTSVSQDSPTPTAIVAAMQGASSLATGDVKGSLRPFDQTLFFGAGAGGLGTTGYLFVPAACEGPAPVCGVHIVLEDCSAGEDDRIDAEHHIADLGFDASARGVIFLFPRLACSPDGVPRTWDWRGSTGPLFLTVRGKELWAVHAMVGRLLGEL